MKRSNARVNPRYQYRFLHSRMRSSLMFYCFMQLLLFYLTPCANHFARRCTAHQQTKLLHIGLLTKEEGDGMISSVPSLGPGYYNCTILCTHPAVLSILC